MKSSFILLLFLATCYGRSARKMWFSNLNFDRAENWDKKRIPCANDMVIIPENSESVFLQTNTTLREMVLPINGEVVLGQDVVINFSSDPAVDLECAGEEIFFTRNETKNWFDPANWKDEDLVVNVETEMIPCTYDRVFFPINSMFHSQLDLSVTVATMKIGYETYTTDSLNTFLRSPAGQKQFNRQNSASVELTQRTQCPDITGCECGNDRTVIKQKICSLYECPNIACQRPLQASGGCCSICGALLSMNYDANKFNMDVFQQDMYEQYANVETTAVRKKRDTEEVYLYISKVAGDRIQMVLTDNVPGTNNGEAASNTAVEINEELKNSNKYGVYNISLSRTSDGADYNKADDLGAGAVTGIVITALVLLVITIILSYLFVKKRPLSRAWFKKDDEPLDASLEMAPGIAVVDFMAGSDRTTQGFDNPMYDSPTKENFYMDPSKPFPNLDDDTSFSTEERKEDILAFSNPLPDDLPDKRLKKTAPAEEDGVKSFTNPLPEDLGEANAANASSIIIGMENEADA